MKSLIMNEFSQSGQCGNTEANFAPVIFSHFSWLAY